MYIACSSLCFSNYPLERALKTIHELRFAKVDLAISEQGNHIKPSEVMEDVNRVAQKLRATNMAFAAFHLDLFSEDCESGKEMVRAVCRLARLLTVPVVSIPAASDGTEFDSEVARLQSLSSIAQTEGVILTLITDSYTLTANPTNAIELCRSVPGLGLTLDPSHYLKGPHRIEEFDPLLPYVRHVRLRDSKGEKLQVRVGQGELEYGKIITSLSRLRYERALTVDIHDHPERDYEMEPEVRKLKYLLESML